LPDLFWKTPVLAVSAGVFAFMKLSRPILPRGENDLGALASLSSSRVLEKLPCVVRERLQLIFGS